MFKQIKSKLIFLKAQIDRLFDILHTRKTGFSMIRHSQITENIFLGGQFKRLGLKQLKKLDIKGIVNMRTISEFPKEINDLGMELLHLPTIDMTAPSLADLQKGVKFMKHHIDKGNKVYVHCKHGIGRGPTMVLAYLISKGMLLDDALTLVTEKRSFVRPNRKQKGVLNEFMKIFKNNE